MRITDEKHKNSIKVLSDDGEVYLLAESAQEQKYFKYVSHAIINDLTKIVFSLGDDTYLFVRRADNHASCEEKIFADESEFKFEVDVFFEGKTAEIVDAGAVKGLRSLNRNYLVIAVITTGLLIIAYGAVMELTGSKKFPVKNQAKSAPVIVPLTPDEKRALKRLGNEKVLEKLQQIINNTSAQERIPELTVQTSESQTALSFIFVVARQFTYPPVGSDSKQNGIWGKIDSENVTLDRKDLLPVPASPPRTSTYEQCVLSLLKDGFYPYRRESLCASFNYEGAPYELIRKFARLVNSCDISINKLNLSSGKGVIDVQTCK